MFIDERAWFLYETYVQWWVACESAYELCCEKHFSFYLTRDPALPSTGDVPFRSDGPADIGRILKKILPMIKVYNIYTKTKEDIKITCKYKNFNFLTLSVWVAALHIAWTSSCICEDTVEAGAELAW